MKKDKPNETESSNAKYRLYQDVMAGLDTTDWCQLKMLASAVKGLGESEDDENNAHVAS